MDIIDEQRAHWLVCCPERVPTIVAADDASTIIGRVLRAIVSGCDHDKYCDKIMILTLAKQVFSRFGDAPG
jgi:hypothetical protein